MLGETVQALEFYYTIEGKFYLLIFFSESSAVYGSMELRVVTAFNFSSDDEDNTPTISTPGYRILTGSDLVI